MWAPHGPRATVHRKITDITWYYVLAIYSKFNATFLNIYSICESSKHDQAFCTRLSRCIASCTDSVFLKMHVFNPLLQHCSCPLMHAEAFVCDCWQAFTAAQILPIPRKEDARIHPSSADILERAAVFSQPSNGWHVFLKTGRWSQRGKASTPQSAFVIGWCSTCWFCWINSGESF